VRAISAITWRRASASSSCRRRSAQVGSCASNRSSCWGIAFSFLGFTMSPSTGQWRLTDKGS